MMDPASRPPHHMGRRLMGGTEMIGKLIGVILVGLLGIVFIAEGYLLWKKEKFSLLHSYHTDRVSPEDLKAFCTLSGIGVALIGLGLLATAVILWFTDSAASFLCFGVCFAVGLAFLIAAGVKYNR